MAEQRTDLGDVSQEVVKGRREPSESYEAFLDELRGGLRQGVDAEEALKAALCMLGRRLSRRERVEFEAQLHPKLAYFLRTCPVHRGGMARVQRLGRDELLQDVADHLRVQPDVAESIVRTVFTALRDRLPEDEAHDVAAQLPADLADLFRRPV
jgi:uncharacterized protein (DUF2267 family)